MDILETERLILRPLVLEDAAALYSIYSDPETMKFMGQAPDSVAQERNNIQSHIIHHYEKCEAGLWATLLKDNNQLIGRCGLMHKQIGGVPEVELAYLLGRKYWSKGLATEAAAVILQYGFTKCGLSRIVAVIHPQNAASIRIAEKIGMKYEREVMYGEFGTVALYAIAAGSAKA
jgi:RimJ/RimL family protein N-acetyltransferase